MLYRLVFNLRIVIIRVVEQQCTNISFITIITYHLLLLCENLTLSAYLYAVKYLDDLWEAYARSCWPSYSAGHPSYVSCRVGHRKSTNVTFSIHGQFLSLP